MKQLGSEVQAKVDWSGPRLLCIAGNYTKYDEHAVQQINRNIELFRYQQHTGYLVLELVNATTGAPDLSDDPAVTGPKASPTPYKTVSQYYEQAPLDLRNMFEALDAYLMALGNDVTKKTLKLYFAFRRIKNFACVEFRPQLKHLLVFVKVDPSSVNLEQGFTRDVSSIGHFGTGDLEITIASMADLERAKPLMLTSYEGA
jgi:predicted transport protein